MKKTKIVCTMGPNTNDKNLMKELALNGMDIARFNFSHGDYEEHTARFNLLKEVREETGIAIGALLDTKGPEIRTGLLKDGQKVSLVTNQKYVLTINECIGDENKGFINYAGLVEDVKEGDKILIDDGLIELKVESVSGADINCVVINGGELGEKKGINVPGVKIKLPALTDKDKEDIRFGIKTSFDFIAASFVRNAQCIKEIKDILKEAGSRIQVIAKIENAEGIENIDSIIAEADGIMVARGDMGVEIPVEQVPYIQKMIIKKCNDACKPVITATQMLDSMIRNPRPTRAEVTDITNAIYEGTDAIMLSGETAMGKYPLEALKTMARVAIEAERHIDYTIYRNKKITGMNPKNISNQVSLAAVTTAEAIEADAIVTPTISGFTARMLSKWRPSVVVYSLSPSIHTIRQMQLLWGVIPVKADRSPSTDDLILSSLNKLKEKGYLLGGEKAVVTAGIIPGQTGEQKATHTNVMKVVTVN